MKAKKHFFYVYTASSKNSAWGLGEFSKVRQTQGIVEGFDNCLNFTPMKGQHSKHKLPNLFMVANLHYQPSW